MEQFETIRLWEHTPGYDGRDPLQKEPYMVFIPAEETAAGKKAGTILVAHGGGFGIRTGCEGPNIAWYFHRKGYNTAILTGPIRSPLLGRAIGGSLRGEDRVHKYVR